MAERLRTRLADWPFAFKMALPSALAMIALMLVGGFADHQARRQTRLLQQVVGQDLAVALRLSQDGVALQQANSGLYRLLTLQAAHTPGLQVEKAAAGLTHQIESVRRDLTQIDAQIGGLAQKAAIPAAIEQLARYRDTTAVVGTMLEVDFPTAVGLVRPFDDNARQILENLSRLMLGVVEDARRGASESEASAGRVRSVFLAALAGAFLLVSVCAYEITRRTVRSMRRIARATLLVANGDQALRIDSLARHDELGAIVDSLRSFQFNNARINFLAHHDALTALPNRTLFHKRVMLALEQSERGKRFALHCVDLDRFKVINDTLGHPAGDALLQSVAARLTECVQEGDTVARLGGDEFAVVQLGLRRKHEATQLAQRIIDALGKPYMVGGHQIIVGASIGVATTPCEDQSLEGLLRNADMALYQAKADGRGMWRIFEPDMDLAIQQQRVLEMDMRSALTNNEFELYYQPLVTVQTRNVSGFEALIRWNHPQRGMIPPMAFIPLAESTDLILLIGAWVLRQACADAAGWPPHLKVAVNLSPVQFKDTQLVQTVQRALSSTGLPPWRLDLEITEGVLLEDNEPTLAKLHSLRALGINISMDDFGTGYSSLSYLRSFPFDKIKIDKSFIRDLAEQGDAVAIVRAVTGLSKSLGIRTIAEGVETEEQFTQLLAEGCTEVQGYLFSPPRPAREVPRLIQEISRRPAAGLVPVVAMPG